MNLLTNSLRNTTIALLFIWALVNLVATGHTVSQINFKKELSTNPSNSQDVVGDSYTHAVLQFDKSQISNNPGIGTVFVGQNKDPELFIYYWNTYWLYPKEVKTYTSLEESLKNSRVVIVYSESVNIDQLIQQTAKDLNQDVQITKINDFSRMVQTIR